MTISDKVRDFLKRGPGAVFGYSPHDVLAKAWALSRLKVSLGDFTDALHRENYRPYQLGSRWALALPSSVNK